MLVLIEVDGTIVEVGIPKNSKYSGIYSAVHREESKQTPQENSRDELPAESGYHVNSTFRETGNFVVEQYGKSNPLEAQLYSDFTSLIPDWYPANLNARAQVTVGFESFARAGALRYVAAGVDDFEKNQVGLEVFKPGIVSSFFMALKGQSSADLVSKFREALKIETDGPQVVNKQNYERAFGRPPHEWSAYGDGFKPYIPKE